MLRKSVLTPFRLLIIVVVVLATAAIGFRTQPVPAGASSEVETEESDILLKREQYWKDKRGDLTAADIIAAREYAKTMPQQQLPPANGTASTVQTPPDVPTVPSGTWSLIGPNPISSGVNYSGRIPAIAVDKTTSGASTVIYLGGANGGVWKSSNNGSSWTPLTDTKESLAIGALAIDPNNHLVVYAGTGEANRSADSYYGAGVLKSTDGGSTWTLYGNSLFGTRTNTVARIVVNPLNSNQVFAATSFGLAYSNDAGVTWAKSTATGLPNSGSFTVDDVVIDSSVSPIKIYVVGRSYGVYKSSDGGTTFAQQTIGLPASSAFGTRNRMAIAPSNPNVLYLVVVSSGYILYSSGSYNGGYWTSDGGATWNSMVAMTADPANGGFGGQGWYDLNIAVDPLNDSLIYVAGVDVHSATNARGTAATGGWRNITNVYGAANSSIHPDQHALAFGACAVSPCRLYVGNDGGIFYTDNGNAAASSVTYTNLNNALAIAEFVGGDIGPNYATTPLALGGTQDNGTMRYTGAAAWPVVRGGDGGFARINWQNPSIMYGEQYSLSIARSTNGGTSWSSITSGIAGTPLFYAPFNIDRTDSNHLVYGTDRVNETLNGTSPWYAGSTVLESGVQISGMAIAPSNGAIVYVGLTNGHIYKTSNAKSGTLATYTQISTGINSNQWINEFWIDPYDPNIAYVATGRFYRSTIGYIYKTTNGGGTWTNISSNLPSIPVNSVVAYNSNSGRVLIVGTDAGVFFSSNDGGSWSALNTGLPLSAVNQLAIDPAQTTLLAFTHGRSVWKLTLPTTTVSPDTIGVYKNGVFYLRNSNTAGAADIAVGFGGDPSDLPVAGDWNGDKVDTIGVYRSSVGVYYLSDSNTSPAVNYSLTFGNPGDTPFAGKWTLAMTHDGVGVYRNSNGVLYEKSVLTTGFSDYFAIFGNPGDQGIAGDWNGDGLDSIGVYRSSNTTWFMTDNSQPGGVTFSQINFTWNVGSNLPVVGDWDANMNSTAGVYDPTSGQFSLINTHSTPGSLTPFAFGPTGGYPLAGHWIGTNQPPTANSIIVYGNHQAPPPVNTNADGDNRAD